MRPPIAIAVAALEGVSAAQAQLCMCVRAHDPPNTSLLFFSFVIALLPFSLQEPATKGSRTADDKRTAAYALRPSSHTAHSNGRRFSTACNPMCAVGATERRANKRLRAARKQMAEKAKRGERTIPAGETSLFSFFLSPVSPQRTRVLRECNGIVRTRGGRAAAACPPAEPNRRRPTRGRSEKGRSSRYRFAAKRSDREIPKMLACVLFCVCSLKECNIGAGNCI